VNGEASGLETGKRRARRANTTVPAIVLKRSDFRESSRIVTCVTREHGRITALAKGAHRADSVFQGRIDFLNEVRATFSADRGGLRLLVRAELVRERRALREPLRFLAASHLAQLCDFAIPDGRAAPEAYDLLAGGLSLLELCPATAIGIVVLGLEVRHLALLGALPDLDRCSTCEAGLGSGAFRNEADPGFVCRMHATMPRVAVSIDVLDVLRALRSTPGRQWPRLETTVAPRAMAPLLASWLAVATEQRSRLRSLLFDRL